jgi:excisionase family DNA binding protein
MGVVAQFIRRTLHKPLNSQHVTVSRAAFFVLGSKEKSMSEILGNRLLTRKEAALYLGLEAQTLAVWHSQGRYDIPVVKIGRSVRYRMADLDEWVRQRIQTQSK